MRGSKGFTVVELAVVVTVLGLIVAIGLVNFIRMKDNSTRASCHANQRNIAQAVELYLADNPTATGAINVSTLQPGYVKVEISECPDSNDGSNDDYTLTLAGGDLSTIVCDIQPVPHAWTAP